MRYLSAIFLLLFLGSNFLVAQEVYPLTHPAEEVMMLANRNYYPIIHQLIDQAEVEILIIMYQARTYPEHPAGVNEQLYQDLFNAVDRGVYVEIILDASSWNMGSTFQNLQLANLLRGGGVNVLWDPPDVTSHNKMLLIDNDVVVIGSTNWSYYALARNNEISVMVKSPQLYQEVREYYNSIKEHSTFELILDEE
jgi:phosphatidylserine/phosphatidylglycerophosphate/cardiolipin synthase-like enzyme